MAAPRHESHITGALCRCAGPRPGSPHTALLQHFSCLQWIWGPLWWRWVRAYAGNWVTLRVVGGQQSHLVTLSSPIYLWASSCCALGDEHHRNPTFSLFWLCVEQVIPNGHRWFHSGWVVAFSVPDGTLAGWSQWGAHTTWGLGHSRGSTARQGVAWGNLGSHIPATAMPAKLFRTRLSTETNTNKANVPFESLQRTSNQVL